MTSSSCCSIDSLEIFPETETIAGDGDREDNADRAGDGIVGIGEGVGGRLLKEGGRDSIRLGAELVLGGREGEIGRETDRKGDGGREGEAGRDVVGGCIGIEGF